LGRSSFYLGFSPLLSASKHLSDAFRDTHSFSPSPLPRYLLTPWPNFYFHLNVEISFPSLPNCLPSKIRLFPFFFLQISIPPRSYGLNADHYYPPDFLIVSPLPSPNTNEPCRRQVRPPASPLLTSIPIFLPFCTVSFT